MGARILVMFAVMTMELDAGIAAILATISEYTHPGMTYSARARWSAAPSALPSALASSSCGC